MLVKLYVKKFSEQFVRDLLYDNVIRPNCNLLWNVHITFILDNAIYILN
jgi:hypothetical protein